MIDENVNSDETGIAIRQYKVKDPDEKLVDVNGTNAQLNVEVEEVSELRPLYTKVVAELPEILLAVKFVPPLALVPFIQGVFNAVVTSIVFPILKLGFSSL